MKTKICYRYLCDSKTNGVTVCGLILRIAGITAFILFISLDLDKLLN